MGKWRENVTKTCEQNESRDECSLKSIIVLLLITFDRYKLQKTSLQEVDETLMKMSFFTILLFMRCHFLRNERIEEKL
jgi:hypothetical protein